MTPKQKDVQREQLILVGLVRDEKFALFSAITNAHPQSAINDAWRRVFDRLKAPGISFAVKETSTWQSIRDNKWASYLRDARVRYSELKFKSQALKKSNNFTGMGGQKSIGVQTKSLLDFLRAIEEFVIDPRLEDSGLALTDWRLVFEEIQKQGRLFIVVVVEVAGEDVHGDYLQFSRIFTYCFEKNRRRCHC